MSIALENEKERFNSERKERSPVDRLKKIHRIARYGLLALILALVGLTYLSLRYESSVKIDAKLDAQAVESQLMHEEPAISLRIQDEGHAIQDDDGSLAWMHGEGGLFGEAVTFDAYEGVDARHQARVFGGQSAWAATLRSAGISDERHGMDVDSASSITVHNEGEPYGAGLIYEAFEGFDMGFDAKAIESQLAGEQKVKSGGIQIEHYETDVYGGLLMGPHQEGEPIGEMGHVAGQSATGEDLMPGPAEQVQPEEMAGQQLVPEEPTAAEHKAGQGPAILGDYNPRRDLKYDPATNRVWVAATLESWLENHPGTLTYKINSRTHRVHFNGASIEIAGRLGEHDGDWISLRTGDGSMNGSIRLASRIWSDQLYAMDGEGGPSVGVHEKEDSIREGRGVVQDREAAEELVPTLVEDARREETAGRRYARGESAARERMSHRRSTLPQDFDSRKDFKYDSATNTVWASGGLREWLANNPATVTYRINNKIYKTRFEGGPVEIIDGLGAHHGDWISLNTGNGSLRNSRTLASRAWGKVTKPIGTIPAQKHTDVKDLTAGDPHSDAA